MGFLACQSGRVLRNSPRSRETVVFEVFNSFEICWKGAKGGKLGGTLEVCLHKIRLLLFLGRFLHNQSQPLNISDNDFLAFYDLTTID